MSLGFAEDEGVGRMIATCGHPLAKPVLHHKGADKAQGAYAKERGSVHARLIGGQMVTDYILSSVTAMVPTARLKLKAAESWA